MSIQCPYCNKELKDGARFCTGCGRQLGGESTDVAATALSDLKQCFGAYPASKMDCYLCADEAKCASSTEAQRTRDLLEQAARLAASIELLNENVVSGFRHTIEIIDTLNSNIVTMNNNLIRR